MGKPVKGTAMTERMKGSKNVIIIVRRSLGMVICGRTNKIG